MKKGSKHFGWLVVSLVAVGLGIGLALVSKWSGDAADKLQDWVDQ